MARKKPRASSTESGLERLASARSLPHEEARALISESLRAPSNHVVARAAELARELELTELAPEMEAAFSRFLEDARERDKTCSAKLALARALESLDTRSWDTFSVGMKHVQLEPEWGRSVDTAAQLRAICAAGLARSRDPAVVLELVQLLVDPEKMARVGAAQALGVVGAAESVPVLRLKALLGDQEVEVIAECFASLLALDVAGSLAFVAGFLESGDEAVREVAAIALGQSRHPPALAALRALLSKGPGTELVRVVLLAMAVMRTAESMEALLGLIERDEYPSARLALSALAIYRSDAVLMARVKEAVERSGSEGLLRRFAEEIERPQAP